PRIVGEAERPHRPRHEWLAAEGLFIAGIQFFPHEIIDRHNPSLFRSSHGQHRLSLEGKQLP
ncbi:MAG: hypothetical protein JWM19_2390, partial [Actinomycetia bacterium]|nr:hypothetical protein [Actinomycetes bacterium]